MTLSDRIVLFRLGTVEQVGTPEDLYQRPNTLFAARFLGDSNTFPVTRSPDGVVYDSRTWPADTNTIAPAADPAATLHAVVRPESTNVARDGAPADMPAVRVRITDLEYVGAFVRLVAQTVDRDNLVTAKLPPGGDAPDIGEEADFWWRPADQRIVRA